MEKLTFKKILLIVAIIVAIAFVFVLIESKVFQTNVKNAKADSTLVEPLSK